MNQQTVPSGRPEKFQRKQFTAKPLLKKGLKLVIVLLLFLIFNNNADAIVMDGLVSWWKFEEASGTIYDETANDNDGTYNGALYQEAGKIGYGLGFDGQGDYVDCGNDASLQLTDNFSVEAWVYSGQGGMRGIISKQISGAQGGWSLAKWSTNKFAVIISDSSSCDYIWSNNDYPDPGWHHIVIVADDGTTYLYIDGVKQDDFSTQAISESGLNLVIGRLYSLLGYVYTFNGTLDEVRIYNKALTEAEVIENFGYIPVDPSNCAIVLPDTTDQAQLDAGQFAAEELQKHIELITGVTVNIFADDSTVQDKYRFYVGNLSTFGSPHKAQWVVSDTSTVFTGNDNVGAKIAVYAFLEEQLGVRWIEPGDSGIMYTESKSLSLIEGTHVWEPALQKRQIRNRTKVGEWAPVPESSIVYEFRDFGGTEEDHDAIATAKINWQLRMRMGNFSPVPFGHAFTDWWSLYGTTHPEYFALNQYGEREPEGDPTRVKLCVSNSNVVAQVITNWQAAGTKQYLNICVNDGNYGYCRCGNCMALDEPEQGEVFGDHLTDRYVYFANQVAIAAKAIRNDVIVVMYAYNACHQPPREQTLESNVIVVAVPTRIDGMAAYYQGWKTAGAQMMGTRPNYPYTFQSIIIPMGFEKQMYEAFQAAYTIGGVSIADYDCLIGLWKPHGMTDYILSKAMSDPSKSYDYWENHYCSAFGNAAVDVKNYYAYWRNFWETELLPDIDDILVAGASNFNRGLLNTLDDYYTASHFDAAKALLQAGANKTLTDYQRAKLDQMILAVEHAKKAYNAIVSNGTASEYTDAMDLVDFRIDNMNNLDMFAWIDMFWTEMNLGDLAHQEGAHWTRLWLDYYDDLTYDNAVVMDGLVAWWKFEEASGTIYDETANDNDGTYNGALYQEAGKIGYGLGFDGQGDYVDCGNDVSLQLTNNFSVETWVYSGQADTIQGIITKQISGGKGGWSLAKWSHNKFAVIISDTSSANYMWSIFSYPSPDWHHVVVVVDNGTADFYIDGVKQFDSSTKAISESGLNLMIGRLYSLLGHAYTFNGALDDIRIYNKALTAEEVNQNYRYSP